MTLAFPNKTRNIDGNSSSVRFTGYDGLLLIEFSISTSTLDKLDKGGNAAAGKNYLTVFDALRDKIETVAIKAYSRGKKPQYNLGSGLF